jgi:hypothetical protein
MLLHPSEEVKLCAYEKDEEKMDQAGLIPPQLAVNCQLSIVTSHKSQVSSHKLSEIAAGSLATPPSPLILAQSRRGEHDEIFLFIYEYCFLMSFSS